VTRYHCLEYLRKQTTIKKHYKAVSFEENIEFFESFILDNDIQENIVLSKEALNVLQKHLSQLKEIYSLPMMLYYFNNFTLTEISKYLNLPPSTIKWRLYTGRQILKKDLIKGGYFND
jgi:RNA polymerase sigma-70 factor, ECF subfamily